MSRPTRHDFDILVVGGGPAGMAAAASAATTAGTVGIVDDNPRLGGQIWREHSFASNTTSRVDREAAKLYSRVQNSGVSHLPWLRVYDGPEPGMLCAETSGGGASCELRYRKLILATGARERFLPFPGWTLRNVMGAGALQAMVKGGLPIAGKRVVIAGSGPLLLAVAAYLRAKGAQLLCVCEQAPLSNLARFATGLIGDPQRLAQGLRYRVGMRGTAYRAGWWPLAAQGNTRLEAVVLSNGHKTVELASDYLACGFHLVPNIELPALLGCDLQDGKVRIDVQQQTSIPNVYCAGEPTGIGGLEHALLEGEIAGLSCAGYTEGMQPLLREKEKLTRFATRLERAFALRDELKSLPTAKTIFCRCEDVLFGDVSKYTSWRAAKLQTRCGMGACQGRICGPAAEFLLQWKADSVRPPILPVRFDTMVGTRSTPKNEEKNDAVEGCSSSDDDLLQ